MVARTRSLHPWRRRFKLLVFYTEIIALLLLVVMLGAIGATFYSVARFLPSSADIGNYQPTEATKIISDDGVVLAEVFEENREFAKLDDIPKALQDATIAIEDSRFYKHIGIDLKGIARALYQNLRKKEISQGGSTITQQLARNIYLTREKTLSRKLQEVVLALQLERNFSKQQILELYLNEVYYGSGACGVQAASKVYFGKEVKNLTLSQCALIAGLPQKPSVYSPHENLDLAIKRRNVVLDRMAELGYI
ncbi:MAG: transglycosylase domain-containing protein, partial [Armatimonadota bacterium]